MDSVLTSLSCGVTISDPTNVPLSSLPPVPFQQLHLPCPFSILPFSLRKAVTVTPELQGWGQRPDLTHDFPGLGSTAHCLRVSHPHLLLS